MEINREFENGVGLYTCTDSTAHGFCLSLWVRRGSMHEPEAHPGLAHFLEHAIFRNISERMGGRLYETLNQRALTFDACTYDGYVRFYISGPVRYFQDGLALLMDVLARLDLSLEGLDLERRRVKAEILEKDDENSADFQARRRVWAGTPLARPLMGTSSSLNRMGFDALRTEHGRWFSAGNFFFCATGNIPDVEALGRVVSELRPAVSDSKTPWLAPVPDGFFHRNAQIEVEDRDYTWVRFCFDADTARYREAEIMVLCDWLFSESGKFYMALSENTGMVYGVDDYFERYANIGNLCFDFEATQRQMTPAIEAAVDLLDAIKEGRDGEVEAVKQNIIEGMDVRYDDYVGFNHAWGYDNGLKRCGYGNLAERKADYAAIRPERIRQIAREIFIPENLLLFIRGNRRRIHVESVRALLLRLSD